MAAEHWFRWHHGTVTDPKFRVIAARAARVSRNVTVGHVLSVWAVMLECASQASPRGQLESWDDEDAAAALGFEVEQVAAIREAMQGKTLDGRALSGWNRRQPRAEDATAASRKRAQREREKAAAAVNVTECHGTSRAVTTETETETEKKEQEQEQGALPLALPSPPAPAAPEQVAPAAPRGEHAPPALPEPDPTPASGTTARGTRLPSGWRPDPDLVAWTAAEFPHVDAAAELAKFRDYWTAKPGADGRKSSWSATWRNWIRRAAESPTYRRPPPGAWPSGPQGPQGPQSKTRNGIDAILGGRTREPELQAIEHAAALV